MFKEIRPVTVIPTKDDIFSEDVLGNRVEDQEPQQLTPKNTYIANEDPETDPTNLFLREAAGHSLLTHEEEKRLALEIEIGRKALKRLLPFYSLDGKLPLSSSIIESLKQVVESGQQKFSEDSKRKKTNKIPQNGSRAKLIDRLQNNPGCQEEIKQRIKEVETAIEAVETFETSNAKLVVHYAAELQKKHNFPAINLLDLVDEGFFGLRTAILRFDYRKGYKLSTYATWWIRQKIDRAIAEQGRPIRFPQHVEDNRRKTKRTVRSLTEELGREPTVEEIAQVVRFYNGRRPTAEQIRELIDLTKPPCSLNLLISNHKKSGEESELLDLIPGEDDFSENTSNQIAIREAVAEILSDLTPREQKIFVLRFGLKDGRSRTLEEVSREFDVTRERIRQIEKKAIKKILAREDAPQFKALVTS